MSLPRHREIFPSDGGASPAANASAHRLDEFPAGYSSAGCSPALPASASPAGHQYAVMSSCRSSTFHRTANCVLSVCVSRGGKRSQGLDVSGHRVINRRIGTEGVPTEQYVSIEESSCRNAVGASVHIPCWFESPASGIVEFQTPVVGSTEKDLPSVQQSRSAAGFTHMPRS